MALRSKLVEKYFVSKKELPSEKRILWVEKFKK
jgi:hypothetical protein